jgi:hypothetical protein
MELWDMRVGSRILWETMLEPQFPALLRQTIEMLRRGEGETRSEGLVPTIIAGFDALFVAGGRSGEPAIRSSLLALGLPVFFSQTPDYPGSEEGLRLLEDSGSVNGWVCDLGQTAFKISSRTQRMKFERDVKRLPIRTDDLGESIAGQRHEMRRWLTESLRSFATVAGSPDALVIALPSRLNESAVPEGSSYIGMGNDAALIGDVMNAFAVDRARPRRVWVMNDAELATLEALRVPASRSRKKTLVVTLGFALGAALVMPEERRANA